MPISRPMRQMLEAMAGRLSLHMPGHKGQAPFGEETSFGLDTTELPVTDDLYAPEGAIAKAQALMAEAAGAGHSIMLTGGSTAGIHAMLLYAAGPGEEVILPRSAHLACVNACVLADLRPVFVPLACTRDGYAFAPEEGFLQAIREHPHARAVLVTRPDYYGGAVDLKRIARAAHEAGMRLLADEAHGAHFPWMEGIQSAGALGADLWVQSAHKTLPALTGGAWLHLKQGEDSQRALRMLRMVQTSSPGFSLMASLDDARAFMQEQGAKRLRELKERLGRLREALPGLGYADAHGLWRDLPLSFDFTRLVIAAPQGGFALGQSLRELGIDVEAADGRRVICILTVMDGPRTHTRLLEALKVMGRPEEAPVPPVKACPLPVARMSPRQAALSPLCRVPLDRAAGRTAGACAGLYPPGIPLVVPGEEITAQAAEILRTAPASGRFGLEDGELVCVEE